MNDSHTWDKSDAPLFSPDGKTVLVLIYKGGVEVWEMDALELKRTLENTDYPLLFEPDTGNIVTRNKRFTEVQIWNPTDGIALSTRKVDKALQNPSGLRVNGDGRRIVPGHENRVTVIDAVSHKVLKTLQIDDTPFILEQSPDGRKVVVAESNRAAVWDVNGGKLVSRLSGHEQTITQVLFLPDSRRVITSNWDSTIRVWDAEPGMELNRLTGHLTGVYWAALSQDASTILTVSDDKSIRLWNTLTFRQVYQFEEYNLWYPVFSPKGDRLLTMDRGFVLHMWNVRRD